jgi:plastocyanin
MASRSSVRGRLVAVGALLIIALFGLTGCELTAGDPNLVNGKEQFIANCGPCHTLARAGTTGVTAPNLDETFRVGRAQGMGESTFEGVVRRQIQHPMRLTQVDPTTFEYGVEMPADLVEGDDARDVAAYVSMAAAQAGEDEGRLAEVGPERPDEVAEADGRLLEIPADPSGALLYVFDSATASPGPLTITSVNESSIPHNIALEGGGVDEVGEVVQDGGVSEIEVEVEEGEYTYYCSVPGHREGGMLGTLTVE